MNVEKKEIHLPSRLESVEKAAMEAADFGSRAGCSEEQLFAIDMAVRESVANAVKHGNKLDETKTVELTFINSKENLEITVRDFGTGFVVEEVPDPTNPENLLKANGRGILFMKTFMDEVEWFNHGGGGMVVKMRKNIKTIM